MSFSSETKEELSRRIGTARHCKIAEMAAIISICGHFLTDERENLSLRLQTEKCSCFKKILYIIAKNI